VIAACETEFGAVGEGIDVVGREEDGFTVIKQRVDGPPSRHFALRAAAREDGFMLAPVLYMLALAGVGAAVMFSGYSQVLRSNSEMTAINSVRQQLQAAGQTLSASSVLDTATSSIVQPPAVSPLANVIDTNRFPALPSDTTPSATELGSYLSASGSPNHYGVIDVNTGVRQLEALPRTCAPAHK
jgi:hypothetical protein